jgi:hypothetical protein
MAPTRLDRIRYTIAHPHPRKKSAASKGEAMRTRVALSLSLVILVASVASAQQAEPSATSPVASKRTDLYHVHFVKAVPGKTTELLSSLTSPDPSSAMPTHVLILRHLEGDDWDFAAVQHLGAKFTLDASTAPPAAAAARELRAWHADTYVLGPPWPEFAKAMGIGQAQAGAAAPGKDIYVVATYRGAAGHREQLEETLKKISASGLQPASAVILQHREGSPWDYLWITRYNDWKDFAAQQDDPAAEERARRAGFRQDPGLELRNHMASHHDTIAERVAVGAPAAAK